MFDGERVPALLEDVARFAVSARRVAARGHARFVDLSTAADHLPSSFREARPDIDWSGIRPVRDFVAHDHDGTDTEVLWRVIAVEFPRIAAARAK
ncbi:HepT-like ribonuclease domain-containing protein [Clavibacter californiensis]|uniref:HepT-like ribonuclease domain-containing protein n=1 Tax=Clavibacter californiensis TaxID=1401995 RepID=UPI0015FDE705|nr:HepT-like ribonuclease domain-containing protein [Clavibacter californiensis]UKF81592.1 hypothetical protein FGD68_14575 [Clavibacter californiensis]